MKYVYIVYFDGQGIIYKRLGGGKLQEKLKVSATTPGNKGHTGSLREDGKRVALGGFPDTYIADIDIEEGTQEKVF